MTPVALAAKDGVTVDHTEEIVPNSIIVSPKALLKALAQVKPYVSTRSSIQVLGAVKLEQLGRSLFIEATDMECFAKAAVNTEESAVGGFVLPLKALMDALKGMESSPDVTFTEEGNAKVKLQGASGSTTLYSLPLNDFPKEPESEPHIHSLYFDWKVLSDALAWVAPAMSHDETRPVMYGMLLRARNGLVTLVATDSYRMLFQVVPTSECPDILDGDYIVRRLLIDGIQGEIKKQPGIWTLTFDFEQVGPDKGPKWTAGRATFISPDRHLLVSGRLVDGQYPNFRQLIPEPVDGFMVTANAKELLAALKPVQKLLSKSNAPVKLTITADNGPGVLWIEGERQDVGNISSTVNVDVERGAYAPEDSFAIGFNPDFLVEAVALAKETFSMYFLKPLRPAIFFADDPSRQGLIMPIRLND